MSDMLRTCPLGDKCPDGSNSKHYEKRYNEHLVIKTSGRTVHGKGSSTQTYNDIGQEFSAHPSNIDMGMFSERQKRLNELSPFKLVDTINIFSGSGPYEREYETSFTPSWTEDDFMQVESDFYEESGIKPDIDTRNYLHHLIKHAEEQAFSNEGFDREDLEEKLREREYLYENDPEVSSYERGATKISKSEHCDIYLDAAADYYNDLVKDIEDKYKNDYDY